MKRITHIGVDMDHTLIRYNSENFEKLAYKTMLDKLVHSLHYPKPILDLEFDFSLAIRGLVIDRAQGNLLKLSRFGAIRKSYHGTTPIGYKDQYKLYKSTYIDLSDEDFDTIDTAFSISFATLFAQLVDLKDSKLSQQLPDYMTIAKDLNQVLDQAHRDGSIKNVVINNLKDYIIKDPEVVEGLERFTKHGKNIFILTNSEFSYTKELLNFAISPFLNEHKSWQDLFTFIITAARKPSFFRESIQFQKIDPKTEKLTELKSPITPGIYQGGSANQFTEDLQLEPDQILYIGDHIYGDILRLKKSCAWRTALVVEELESEIEKAKKAEPIESRIHELMKQKIPLERKVDELISQKIEEKTEKNNTQIDDFLAQIKEIDKEIGPLIRQQSAIFNPYWGEVMRTGIEESYFAYQVERFACVYMARFSHLLEANPRRYYRSFRRRLAHEISQEEATGV